jgi:hypothetical protein
MSSKLSIQGDGHRWDGTAAASLFKAALPGISPLNYRSPYFSRFPPRRIFENIQREIGDSSSPWRTTYIGVWFIAAI